MKQLRQAILWAVLAVIALLAVLSAVGALIGVDEARDLFSSPPLIAFWALVLLVLASGFAAFRRLITAPAGLAMHLGAILIVAGAM
jgi:ABC-type long-subunit fatty acid transport system fused permease/ATPase subunit